MKLKAFLSVTRQFLRQLWSDMMLTVLMFVPIFMGLAFCFGVPALEAYLCSTLHRSAILSPYYALFDLLLSVMTPVMFTAAGAMLILDEADLGLSRAIAVTPIGRTGYLASRIGVPCLIATLYCFAATLLFKISNISAGRLVLIDLCSGTLGVVTALMISSLAKNKVEGLAYSKLSGLLMIGIPAAILVPSPAQYIAGVLPSFWMTKLAFGESLLNVFPALLVSLLWSAALSRHFVRKILS